MTVTDDLDPFVGRAAEVGVLRSEVAAIRSGMPRIVIVQGDAGAGKTTLIENVVAAEVDVTVLWTSGEAWEVSVANGVVDQLMCVAGLDVARPTAIQYRGAPEEPNVLGARILDVLTGLERAAPVVVVVDDAQWADIGSLRALLFAARRLAKQRLLMMFGQRTEDAHRLPAGLRRLACGRTGTTLTLGPRPAAAAHRSDVGDPSVRSGRRAAAPDRRHRPWDPSLRAAQAFTTHVRGRLDACSHPTQTFVEALVVLGTTDPAAAGIVVGVPDLAAALGEAASAELLHVRGDFGIYTIDFAHPLVAAAVYERLGPARRLQLHTAVTEFVDAAELPLRRRLLAATPPNPRLAVELEAFARREIAVGAWATAAWALVESSRLGTEPESWHQRLLRAVDAALDAVDQPQVFARHVELFTSAAWRDAALGYLAVVRGKRTEAEELLGDAWRHCVEARSATNGDAVVAATVAQRMAVHELGRLRGCEVEAWSRRAIAMARPGDPAREEAEALLGLGIAWQGRIDEGMATYQAMLSRIGPAADGPLLARVQMAQAGFD